MSTCEESKRQLYEGIIEGRPIPELETILWDAVVAYQNQPLRTLSGLEFSYTVKHKKKRGIQWGTSRFPQGNQQNTDKKLCDAGIS